MSTASRGIGPLERRLLQEYLDYPGLRLTPPQAQRLLGTDRAACVAALNALVRGRWLTRDRARQYVCPDGGTDVMTWRERVRAFLGMATPVRD